MTQFYNPVVRDTLELCSHGDEAIARLAKHTTTYLTYRALCNLHRFLEEPRQLGEHFNIAGALKPRNIVLEAVQRIKQERRLKQPLQELLGASNSWYLTAYAKYPKLLSDEVEDGLPFGNCSAIDWVRIQRAAETMLVEIKEVFCVFFLDTMVELIIEGGDNASRLSLKSVRAKDDRRDEEVCRAVRRKSKTIR
jgi:hypothetical protein